MTLPSGDGRPLQATRNFWGQDLRRRSFRGQDLSGADFRQSDLRGCDFRGCDVRSAVFDGARLGRVNDRWLLGWAIGLILAAIQLQAVSLLGFGILGTLPEQALYPYSIGLKLVLGALGLLPWGLAMLKRESWGRAIAGTLIGMMWGFCYGGLATGGQNARTALLAMVLGGTIGHVLGRLCRRSLGQGWLWLLTAVGTYGLAFLVQAQAWDAWAGRLWLECGLCWGGAIGLGGLALLYGQWAAQELDQAACTNFRDAWVEASSWQGIGRSQLRRCGLVVTELRPDSVTPPQTALGTDIPPDRPAQDR